MIVFMVDLNELTFNLQEYQYNSYEVMPEDYCVQVSFNKDLLARGSWHLEEIYLYLNRDKKIIYWKCLTTQGCFFSPFHMSYVL